MLYGSLCLIFPETSQLFPKEVALFYILMSNVHVIHFLHILGSGLQCHWSFFKIFTQSDRYVMSYCDFNLHVPNGLWF